MRTPFAARRVQPGVKVGLVATGYGRLKAKVGMVKKLHKNWKWNE
jgi:hypothetical protein